jgi:hypothetical protein
METSIFPTPVVDPLRLSIAESLLTRSVMLNKLSPSLHHGPCSTRTRFNLARDLSWGDKFLEHMRGAGRTMAPPKSALAAPQPGSESEIGVSHCRQKTEDHRREGVYRYLAASGERLAAFEQAEGTQSACERDHPDT